MPDVTRAPSVASTPTDRLTHPYVLAERSRDGCDAGVDEAEAPRACGGGTACAAHPASATIHKAVRTTSGRRLPALLRSFRGRMRPQGYPVPVTRQRQNADYGTRSGVKELGSPRRTMTPPLWAAPAADRALHCSAM